MKTTSRFKKNFRKIIFAFLILSIFFNQNISLIYAQDSTSSAFPEQSVSLEPPVTNSSPSASITSTPSPTPSPEVATPTATPSQNRINPEVQTKGIFEKNELLSAKIKSNSKIFPLAKKNFQAKENIEIEIKNTYNRDVTVSVKDQNGKNFPAIIQQKYVGDDSKISIIPPPRFRPGKYKLTIIDTQGNSMEQDFTWGVLAINTHKSIYLPNEQVYVAISVLNETGSMVCDATVNLDIISPSGKRISFGTENNTIIVNPDCYKRDVHPKPDYETDFDLGEELGAYQMNLSAVTKNGRYEISDAFDVRQSVPFDVERIATTRIFPLNNYEVKMRITANQDFSGSIIETVPEIFKILPSSSARSYDEIATEEAKLEKDQTLITQTNSLSLPFTGEFVKTQEFGVVPDNLFLRLRYLMLGNQKHDGIDYALPEGTPVLAVDNGEIIQSEEGDYGITVAIQHNWGTTYYGHLSETTFESGKIVNKGDIIGYSGNTGLSTGPHLHFALKPNDEDPANGFNGKVDPIAYIQNSNSSIALNPNKNILGAGTSIFQTKKIKWNLSLTKGETVTIGYIFDPPEISPQFYLLGPLEFSQPNNYNDSGVVIPLSGTPPQNDVILGSEATPESLLNSTSSATLESTSSAALQPKNNSVILGSPDVIRTTPESLPASRSSMSEVGLDSGPASPAGRQAGMTIVFQESRQWQIAADPDITITTLNGGDHRSLKEKPRIVFVSDQVGYYFYNRVSTLYFQYSYTTDGGATWTSDNTLESSGETNASSVWYDKWTPGAIGLAGTRIHLAFAVGATSINDCSYMYLDIKNPDITTDDALSAVKDVDAACGTIAFASNVTITRAVDGDLYYGIQEDTAGDSLVYKCTDSDCSTGTWSDTSITLDAANDYIRLLPLAVDDIMIIRDDISADDIQSQIYDGSSWAGSWTNIDTAAPEYTVLRNSMGVTLRRWNNYIYLGYIANGATLDTGDFRTWVYDGSSWTQKTDVIDAADLLSTEMLVNADMAVDEESGTVYALYNRGTLDTSNSIYIKKSTDGMTTWTDLDGVSGQQTKLNSSYDPEDNRNVYLNLVDSERIYFAYTNATADDTLGGVVANLTPPVPDEYMRHGDWWSRVGTRKTFSW